MPLTTAVFGNLYNITNLVPGYPSPTNNQILILYCHFWTEGPVGAVIGGGLAIVATAGSSSAQRAQRLELAISSISMSRDGTYVFLEGGWISFENPSRWCVFVCVCFYWSCFFFFLGGWVGECVFENRSRWCVLLCFFFSDYFEDQSRLAQLPNGNLVQR